MPRIRPLLNPVTLTLDGEAILAEKGEPIAVALLAAGKLGIARSPKFHRPRGPSCLRGACDGCLARVDEVPNTMTCMVGATDGCAIVTQNRLGPRQADLLRLTDWFFPEGMNHHELFAGVPGVQTIMQTFARRVAGLGRLPTEVETTRSARRREVDVVVVGAGPSGMAVAVAAAEAGGLVEVLDDQLVLGGALGALSPEDAAPFLSLRDRFDALSKDEKIKVRAHTTVGAIYGRDVLVVGADGAEVLEPRALILACGGHDAALAFEGNDIPGVMSARAAGWLLHRHGVVPGKNIVVIVPPGGVGALFGDSYARAAKPHAKVTRIEGELLGVTGTLRVKKVRVKVDGKEQSVDADLVVIDAPRAPAFELAQQAGAKLEHRQEGFVVLRDEEGRIAEGTWAVGEVAGVPFDAAAMQADAVRVVAALQS